MRHKFRFETVTPRLDVSGYSRYWTIPVSSFLVSIINLTRHITLSERNVQFLPISYLPFALIVGVPLNWEYIL